MMRWAGMAMAFSSPGMAARQRGPQGGAGLASAVRIDYESVVVAAGGNPKGAAGLAGGSPRRPGALESRGSWDIRGGCDRYLRIVTTAAMVGNRPPARHRGNP